MYLLMKFCFDHLLGWGHAVKQWATCLKEVASCRADTEAVDIYTILTGYPLFTSSEITSAEVYH